jgi:hypothetical protein
MKNFAQDFTDEERAAWRSEPVTQAFIDWMKGEANDAKSSAIAAVKASPAADLGYGAATSYVGQMTAYDKAVDTATRESFE